MYDYMTPQSYMCQRRHALKPDDVAFLTSKLSKRDLTTMDYEPSPKIPVQKGQDGDIEMEAVTADAPVPTHCHSLAAPVFSTVHQQQDPYAERRKANNSTGLAEQTIRMRPIHKRKYGALYNEEADSTEPSPKAIDIVHPSEISSEWGEYRWLGTTFQNVATPPQVHRLAIPPFDRFSQHEALAASDLDESSSVH
ncbi:MAG: hypothetical protein Q9219_006498 [cf. Caloplaca sp. 3 TL-2023]